jgi:ribosome biogenesis GTP-binding protein YsxC/EngB
MRAFDFSGCSLCPRCLCGRFYYLKPIAKFLTSAVDAAHFPTPGPPEVAFLGRSNVGKSSLLNSLVGSTIARVSNTPGRTQMINFFGVNFKPGEPNPEFLLVDLPGYGYAKAPREVVAQWSKFIDPYLQERESLALCVTLVDASVPPQESDRRLLDFLRGADREFIVVGTKSDRLSGNKLKPALKSLEQALETSPILPYSSKSGSGKAELWRAIKAAGI